MLITGARDVFDGSLDTTSASCMTMHGEHMDQAEPRTPMRLKVSSLKQSCVAMHGGTWVSTTWVMHNARDHMEAQPSMELKCDSSAEAQLLMRLKCMGSNVPSYQIPSKARDMHV